MSEKVYWQELDINSIFSWYIVEAMSKVNKDIFKDFDPQKGIDVTMTINGIEVPFMEIFEMADKQAEDMIKKEAAGMVKSKSLGLMHQLQDMANKFAALDGDIDNIFKEEYADPLCTQKNLNTLKDAQSEIIRLSNEVTRLTRKQS